MHDKFKNQGFKRIKPNKTGVVKRPTSFGINKIQQVPTDHSPMQTSYEQSARRQTRTPNRGEDTTHCKRCHGEGGHHTHYPAGRYESPGAPLRNSPSNSPRKAKSPNASALLNSSSRYMASADRSAQYLRPATYQEVPVPDMATDRHAREATLRTQEKFEMQIQELENDKMGLIKRLNMVLVEHDNAMRERERLQVRLNDLTGGMDNLARKLDQQSNLKSVLSKNLQEDLRYEQEMGDKLKDEIKTLSYETDRLKSKITDGDRLQKGIESESSNLNYNLRRKDDEIISIEQEYADAQARKHQLQDQLDQARNRLLHKEDEAVDLRRQVQDITAQRESLVYRMNQMTNDYEGFFLNSQKAKDKQAFESRYQVQEQCCRKLFQTLNIVFAASEAVAFCAIRDKANRKQLGKRALHRAFVVFGKYALNKKSYYLKLWHLNSLGWLKANRQKNSLVQANDRSFLRRKYFSKWRGVFHKHVKKVDNKCDSIKLLQSAVDKGGRMQMRQAFNLWKGRVGASGIRVELMKTVFKIHYKKTLRRGFIRWVGFMHDINHRVRLEQLTELWTRTRLLQGLFLGWKEGIAAEHREKEEMVFRAWKKFCGDNLQEKYVEKMTAMTNQVEKMKNKVILRKYFDIIRRNAKHELYSGVFTELMEKERPRMEQVRNELAEFGELDHRKKMTNVFRTLLKNFSNSLYSYFMQWKLECGRYNDMMKRIKMLMIRAYKNKLGEAFVLWRRRGDMSRIYDMTIMVEKLGDEAIEKEKHKFSITNELNEDNKREAVRRGRKAGDLLRKFGLRIIRHRFTLWHFNVKRGEVLGDATFKICGKLRKRLLRETFAKYKDKVSRLKREERLRNKLGRKLMGLDSQLKKTAFQGFVMFHDMSQRAKKYLNRMFLKGDRRQLARGMNSWKAAMVNLNETMIRMKQLEIQNEIDEIKRQHEMTDASILEGRRKADLLNDSMEKMGQRTMMKYMNMLLNKQLAGGFYGWREQSDLLRRQENIMNKYMLKLINHFQIGAFQKWKDYNHQERKREAYARRRELEAELKRLKELAARDAQRNQEEMSMLDMSMRDLELQGKRKQAQYNSALNMLATRAMDNEYVDRRRAIFDAWRHQLKMERHRFKKLFSLIKKNHATNFFRILIDRSRLDQTMVHQDKTLQRFFFRFAHNLRRQAFSDWRAQTQAIMTVQLGDAVSNFNKEKQAHKEYQEQQKEINMVKFGRLSENKRKRNILKHFRGITDFLAVLRKKKAAMGVKLKDMRKKGALAKMGGKAVLSREERIKQNKSLNHMRNRSLYSIFTAWHDNHVREVVLPGKIKKALNRFFMQDKSYAIGVLKDFVLSKGDMHRKFKHEGVRKLAILLDKNHGRMLKASFHQIQFRTLSWDQQIRLKKGIFMRGMRRRLRQAYETWRHKVEQVSIITEINRESQVATNAYASRNNVVNMKRMMVSEGYHPDEVDRDVFEKKTHYQKIMERAVKKLKMQANPDLWPLPKAMEAWKDFVNLRKNLKYYADFVRKHTGDIPLQNAFLKWKQYRINSQLPLEMMNKAQLVQICMDNERNVNIQRNHMNDQDAYLSDLTLQKIALFNRCLSGRKLGLTLPREKFDNAKQKAFHRWKHLVHDREIFYLTRHVKQQTALLEKMKDQYHSVEEESNNLIEDNEQLRQASLDGIEIAKAVQELTKQREQLSVDLADRASSLKKLMEDNEHLRNVIAQKRGEVERMSEVLFGQKPQPNVDVHPDLLQEVDQA